MEILFENDQYLVCVKPPECVTESTPAHDGLSDLLSDRNGGYIGVIHRLDRGVGGVMIFAKTTACAAKLSLAAQEHRLQKEYVCLLPDKDLEESGTLTDLLYFDRTKNKVFPVSSSRKGVKEAILRYRVTGIFVSPEGERFKKVSVTPVTGRTHQIRVQFASRGYPIPGDRKYGGGAVPFYRHIALWCHNVTVPAQVTGKDDLTFSFSPPWETESP